MEYGSPLIEQAKNDNAMDAAFQLAGISMIRTKS